MTDIFAVRRSNFDKYASLFTILILRDPYRRAPSSAKITTLSLKHLFQTFSGKKRVNLHKYDDVQTQYQQHDFFLRERPLKTHTPVGA